MPRGACRCCCNAGREARREELPLGSSADLENGRHTATTMATATTAAEKDPVIVVAFRAVSRITKFIVRGLLILLWVYLYNSMRRYAISYIGSDTWFSTFVVIAVAVPIAELFCIVGHIMTTPPPRSLDFWPKTFPRRK